MRTPIPILKKDSPACAGRNAPFPKTSDSTGTSSQAVDKHWIVVLALQALAQEGVIEQACVKQAMSRYLLQ
ncbi:hypothetical protein BK653_08580 [Pseudomonas brassicacearum]|nr:hypothetical protein BK653_08580 [Pseudomonas brassicacearum]